MHLVDLERVRVSSRLWLAERCGRWAQDSRGRFAPTRVARWGDTYGLESGLNGSFSSGGGCCRQVRGVM